ncbi:hypothetical protein E2C01_064428 [Portunus trituberculatus]|uniref:Uncharacterized protein n=1 Tax=Portunus trituberculatus TaxID=210409 RepID=A0A5B7HLS0_PORTR|nr:hypothetical protein [Portunus trituberculatus]
MLPDTSHPRTKSIPVLGRQYFTTTMTSSSQEHITEGLYCLTPTALSGEAGTTQHHTPPEKDPHFETLLCRTFTIFKGLWLK